MLCSVCKSYSHYCCIVVHTPHYDGHFDGNEALDKEGLNHHAFVMLMTGPDDSVLRLPKGLFYDHSDRQGWGVWTTVQQLLMNDLQTGLRSMPRRNVEGRRDLICRTRSEGKRLYFIWGIVECFCIYRTWMFRINAPDKGDTATHQFEVDSSHHLVLRKNPLFRLPLARRRSISLDAPLRQPIQITVNYTYQGQII